MGIGNGNFTSGQTYTIHAFIDRTLTGGQTTIKAVHIMELRARIDVIRSAKFLQAFQWGAALTGGSSVPLAQHILDLRQALREAYEKAPMLLPLPIYTLPDPAAAGKILAIHIKEIRAAVLAIE